MERKIAVLTSGGDAPGMNAAVRAVVRTAMDCDIQVMGVKRGFAGLVSGDLFEMDKKTVSDIISKGGTMLKTARLDNFTEGSVQEQAKQVLQVYGVDGLIVIGGDGSLRGAAALANLGVNTIGIPGTIDNDLVYTDFSLGFDTALNTVVEAMSKIKDTSASHDRCSIIEVMGHTNGNIALYAGIAGGAEMILVPEKPYNFNDVAKMIFEGKPKDKHHFIIVIAEGVGGSRELVEHIQEVTGLDTRLTVLGYVQRGGSPSAADRILAARFGNRAVHLLKEGVRNRAVGIKNNQIIDLDIHEALAMEAVFNDAMLKLAQEIN